MPPPDSVDVILPCLDEAAALHQLLPRIPGGYRAIVVDNGSRDGSADVAAGLGATVVSEPVPGYGAACHRGLLEATADVVVFCDADGSVDPRTLPAVVHPVLADDCDLTVARRVPAAPGAWPLHARLANRYLALRASGAVGARLHDIGPARAARRRALLALDVRDRRFGYPLETVLRAGAHGWRVQQVDVPYQPRIGRSKVTGTVRGTIRAIRDMRAVLRDSGPPRRAVAP